MKTLRQHRARLSWPVRLICAAIGLLLSPAPIAAAESVPDHKQVLVLYSTRRDAQFSVVGQTELPRMLDTALERNLDYYAEFIDLERSRDQEYAEAFRDFLRLKYGDIQFDLVVALQDAALEFVTTHYDTLFPGTPVVFLANTRVTTRPPHSTGVIHERNFAATPALIRQLQPDVRNLFVVSGSAGADKTNLKFARRQLRDADGGLEVTFLSGLRTPELMERLSRLPPNSAVYYILFSEDGDGNRVHPLEYVDRVVAAANAPTYAWVDSTIGHGVVGGSLYSQSAAIDCVGQVAMRVLRGERPEDIPVAAFDLNANRVDWRQLRRWGISEARVPVGTLVMFRDQGIWSRYRPYILTAAGVFLTQSLLITALLLQRRQRQRAERELRGSQTQLRRSYDRIRDLGSRLLRAQDTERSRIARELHDDICQRMLLLTIELESAERRGRGQASRSDALAVARDIAKSLHELSHRLHPTRLRVLGLVAALDRLCVELARASAPIAFSHDQVPPNLPPDVMLSLFRVVQEALQNSVKYSHASAITVNVTGGSNGLSVTVTDNGTGFNVNTAWAKGVGLGSMIERLEAIGGSLDLRSSPGSGTRVVATVPATYLRQSAGSMPLTGVVASATEVSSDASHTLGLM